MFNMVYWLWSRGMGGALEEGSVHAIQKVYASLLLSNISLQRECFTA